MGVKGKVGGSILIILGIAMAYFYYTGSSIIPAVWFDKPIQTLIAILVLVIAGVIFFRSRSSYFA